MWGRSILTALYLFVAIAHGAPYHDSDSSDVNKVVYIYDMYAVKHMSTKAVAKILDNEGAMKLPENFQSIGTVVFADNGNDEPMSMKDFVSYVEESGLEFEKLNEGSEVKIIEIQYDDSLENLFDFENFEELAKALQAEGISLTMSEEDESVVIQIEFDESIKSVEDQPFTLEELGEILEAEELSVSYIKASNGQIKGIRITLTDDENEVQHNAGNGLSSEAKSEMKNEHKIDEKDEKKMERKMEKSDQKQRERKNDIDYNLPLDFTTKSELFNKLRRRRSTSCPECKTASMIKSYIEKHDSH